MRVVSGLDHKRNIHFEALPSRRVAQEIANTILEAQSTTLERVGFYLAKDKFYDRLRGQMNQRQEKAIGRMFRAGVGGFKGGMSAEKCIAITDVSRATPTRDLQDLVAKGAH